MFGEPNQNIRKQKYGNSWQLACALLAGDILAVAVTSDTASTCLSDPAPIQTSSALFGTQRSGPLQLRFHVQSKLFNPKI
jgi:hypothetical protein